MYVDTIFLNFLYCTFQISNLKLRTRTRTLTQTKQIFKSSDLIYLYSFIGYWFWINS